jgi:hypothetical protein
MPAPIPGRRVFSFGLSLALSLACSGMLAAQSADAADDGVAPPSARWHFSLGLGAGKADLTCDGCIFDARTGFSGFVSVARAIRPNTLLGIESTVWKKETTWVYSVMPHLTHYLHSGGGLFLRGGVGLIGFHSDNRAFESIYGIGLGFSSRVGYELALSGVQVAPYVGFARSLGGMEARQGGNGTDTDVTVSSFQAGLSVTAP